MNRDKKPPPSNSSKSSSKSKDSKKKRPWGAYFPPRGKCDPKVPYIIRPRYTALLELNPVLQWNKVAQANHYTVSLSRAGQCLWELETEETQIEYPGDPSLIPEMNYTILVQTDTGISSEADELDNEDESQPIQFSILSEAKAQQVKAEVQQAQAAQTGEAQTLTVAEIYKKHELRAEAIDWLKTAAQDRSERPALYQLLGELYHEVGLLSQAEVSYLKAVKLAKQAQDLDMQALISVRLATVYQGLKKPEEVEYWLRAARVFYDSGDPEATNGLEK